MNAIFAPGPIASQKERNRILFRTEISHGEKLARWRKMRKSTKKEWCSCELRAPRPIQSKENGELGRMPTNDQNDRLSDEFLSHSDRVSHWNGASECFDEKSLVNLLITTY
jgi:hypothetical protein